ncbi:hypothetical protein D8I24_7342 [Cupriavidus necator H850]|uniref:tyrosine-type recombinase/integrase n=1 Tax=Cupriavidus necator TaxID=106590 RepID=UPI00129EDFE9|nr:CHASE domain-containing protein [Cupriavidus necator]KAI3596418.1 hypothetical protein D8I24_7342 [Cupriavidus necator H850]
MWPAPQYERHWTLPGRCVHHQICGADRDESGWRWNKPERCGSRRAAIQRAHDTGDSSVSPRVQYLATPLAPERAHFFLPLYRGGTVPSTLDQRRVEFVGVVSIAVRLDDMLRDVFGKRASIHTGVTMAYRMIVAARPWLRFLGWWREPAVALPFQSHLDSYVKWMRDERGFTPSTVCQWQSRTRQFLQWCVSTDRRLEDLQPDDIDAYFVQNASRWGRISMKGVTGALRIYLRYAATQGLCNARLATALRTPRVYTQESLPSAPRWTDVQRLLATTGTDKPADIRNRAILMLLSIYGTRRGEVVALRLDQVNWAGRTLNVFRLKRRQPQVYPLLPTVAEALASYIDIVRPQTSAPEIFLGRGRHDPGAQDRQAGTHAG